MELVGRSNELAVFESLLSSPKSEFLAVLGRRRVGKTFLIRNGFASHMKFQFTGMANSGYKLQLQNFRTAIAAAFPGKHFVPIMDWASAFTALSQCLGKPSKTKKVVFIDELPWLDTPKSGFMQALEYFWNSWASARKDILLVVCGSASSWMVNKLINNKGGLHNRVTERIHLKPFTLKECEAYFQARGMGYSRSHIMQVYMVLGGIPFYLDQLKKGKSAAQNINALCTDKHGFLQNEFKTLYQSLFKKPEGHIALIHALAKKKKGLGRNELLKAAGLPNGGGSTRMLDELEQSGFIRRYHGFGKTEKDQLYQLTDLYTLFYFAFLHKKNITNPQYWLHLIDTPTYRTWSGLAFEKVCLLHGQQILQSLGISGIQTHISAWQGKTAQIDLVIDRRDGVINLCEIKYTAEPFVLTHKYWAELENKLSQFRAATNTKKALFTTLISSYGLQKNGSWQQVHSLIEMDNLFL
jgi:hypothetical protein